MVDERRLQRRQEGRVLLDRHVVLRRLRVGAVERSFDQIARELAELARGGARSRQEDLPGVQARPAIVVGNARVHMDWCHLWSSSRALAKGAPPVADPTFLRRGVHGRAAPLGGYHFPSNRATGGPEQWRE